MDYFEEYTHNLVGEIWSHIIYFLLSYNITRNGGNTSIQQAYEYSPQVDVIAKTRQRFQKINYIGCP
jgi:hypothetical protein